MLITDKAPCLHDIVMLYGEDWAEPLSEYPIWDETRREWLNSRIYNHFAFREIAQVTPAQFFFFLNRRMCEMMPTINPIFRALDDEVDILSSYQTRDKSQGTTQSTAQNENTTSQKQLYSATPQTQLSGAENYATNLTEATGDDAGKSLQENTDASESTHEGRNAPTAEMLSNWLAGVNNALYIVFNGLEPLFQQVWDD